VVALAFVACNEPSTDNNIGAANEKDSISFNISTARSAVEAVNNKFMESIKKGDSVGAASVYAQDALIMPANSEAISGKDASSFWGSFKQSAGIFVRINNTGFCIKHEYCITSIFNQGPVFRLTSFQVFIFLVKIFN